MQRETETDRQGGKRKTNHRSGPLPNICPAYSRLCIFRAVNAASSINLSMITLGKMLTGVQGEVRDDNLESPLPSSLLLIHFPSVFQLV